jgi:hypothetical protein
VKIASVFREPRYLVQCSDEIKKMDVLGIWVGLQENLYIYIYIPLPSILQSLLGPPCPLFSEYVGFYVLVFLVLSFLLAFPPISYIHSLYPHLCYMPCPSHPP